MNLAKIATFLNLATIKIKAEQGSLRWLTGAATTIAFTNTAASQETQCMSFGSTLWIANNDDGDSTTQKNFLDALGIKKPAKLHDLAVGYGTRVLNYHQQGQNHVLAPGGHSPKQAFLHALMGGGTPQRSGNFAASTAVANGTYTLNTETYPATGAIVFVSGTYEGTGGESEHAEQRLLAALGLLMSNGETDPAGAVIINGCKSACGTCKNAINEARSRLSELKKTFWLDFAHATSDRLRQDSGLGADDNAGIKKLTIDEYFPAAPAAAAVG